MMWFRGKAASPLRLLAVALPWMGTALAKTDPSIVVKSFKHPPTGLAYFPGSDAILFHDIIEGDIYRSGDSGVNWERVEAVAAGEAYMLVMHEFDDQRAYILTEGKRHYVTKDRGKSWTEFDSGGVTSGFRSEILRFHASDPDRIIFNGMLCRSIFCDEVAFYTTDGFATPGEPLRKKTNGCWWAKSTKEFSTGDEDLDKTRILCVAGDEYSPRKEDQRLVISDNYFSGKDEAEFEPNLDTDHPVKGVLNIATVKKYILAATSSRMTDEMSLFVSTDAQKWHRAMFPKHHDHTMNQEAYTVLESTEYSIQIDVMTTRPSNPMGVVFTSNSNGTYFTENIEHTNRNERGLVDFEKISGVQGIFLVNQVQNWEAVEKSPSAQENVKKEIKTFITFDDGRTFESVKAGDERIHLHSVTEVNTMGRVFSSPAPGLVMGNGNTGAYLGTYEDANLYVSDNAGLTWRKALNGAHKYEFGDQGSLLVAVRDTRKEDVDEIMYSLDHGENWEKVQLPGDLRIRPALLTTSQDSSTVRFLLLGKSGGDKPAFQLISIDFGALRERTCGDDDMEDWHARLDEEGKPTCIMGHKQTFRRRKKDADCFIKQEFKEPVVKTEVCDCQDNDFECDYNFVRSDLEDGDGKTCKPVGPMIDFEDACKNAKPGDVFQGSSGWRLIPGSACRRNGPQKDDKIERKCDDTASPPPAPGASGEITHTDFVFKSDYAEFEKIYLERGDSSSQDDETIIVRPYEFGTMKPENKIWRTADHGKTWEKILEGESVRAIYPHTSFNDVVFFTTESLRVIYTVNRGKNFHEFLAPTKPRHRRETFSFHPDKKDWILFVGEKCEDVSDKCQLDAAVSRDRGDSWRTIAHDVRRCEFTGNSAYKFRDEKQIVCLVRSEDDDSRWRVVVSNDFFEDHKVYPKMLDGDVAGEDVRDFATMSEFIVVAAKAAGEERLLALASMDGLTYAAAKFPINWKMAGNTSEYTVLDSSTHAVNLFVAAETQKDRRYGSIIKSNSNGTTYVLSAQAVNCNEDFFVDFEKIPGLEGVKLINSVANPDKVDEEKKLQTKITHNDGSEWAFLPPPGGLGCSGRGDANCALHLHHYTEREDKQKTFGAASAVGIMFGVGNVGPHLTTLKEADTFLTTDGGVSWNRVQKGHWTWQFGDQGSLLVMVQQWRPDQKTKTKTVSYSTNRGDSWKEYQFSDEEVAVTDITSQRSGASRNFLLWTKTGDGATKVINLDFSGLTTRACKADDFETFTPRNPNGEDDCLFGHISKYLRKKKDADCFIADPLSRDTHFENCLCTRQDFECAYNYERDNVGQCSLVPGHNPLSAKEWCEKHPDDVEYFPPSGYRRIPLTTCEGGKLMDQQNGQPIACSGHEDEFEKKHSTSGIAIFFAVVIPVLAAGAVGWWVWRNWQGKFGQIRLGDQPALSEEAPWVKYPVIAISAVVAVVAAIPLVTTSLWRAMTSAYHRVSGGRMFPSGGRNWFRGSGTRRFTTRDSFARGGDYAIVDDDEGELLGEDSDEEA